MSPLWSLDTLRHASANHENPKTLKTLQQLGKPIISTAIEDRAPWQMKLLPIGRGLLLEDGSPKA